MEPPGGEQIGPSNQHDVSAGCIETIRAGLLLKRWRLLAPPPEVRMAVVRLIF